MKAYLTSVFCLMALLKVGAQDTGPVFPSLDVMYARTHFTVSWLKGIETGYKLEQLDGDIHPHSYNNKVFDLQLGLIHNFNKQIGVRPWGTISTHSFHLGRHEIDPGFDDQPRFQRFRSPQVLLGLEMIYRKQFTKHLALQALAGAGYRWTFGLDRSTQHGNYLLYSVKYNRDAIPFLNSGVGALITLPWDHQLSIGVYGRYNLKQLYSGSYTYRLPDIHNESNGIFSSNGHNIMLSVGYHFTGARKLELLNKAALEYDNYSHEEIKEIVRNQMGWTRPENAVYISTSFNSLRPRYRIHDPNSIFLPAHIPAHFTNLGVDIEASFEFRNKWLFYLRWSYLRELNLGYELDLPFDLKTNFPQGHHYPFEDPRFYWLHGRYGSHHIDSRRVEAGIGRRFINDDGKYLFDLKGGIGLSLTSLFNSTMPFPFRAISTGTDTLVFQMHSKALHRITPMAHLTLSRDWQLHPRIFITTALNTHFGFVPQYRFSFDYQHIGNNPVPPAVANMEFKGGTHGFTIGLKYRIAGWDTKREGEPSK